jgi:hypothetical protein
MPNNPGTNAAAGHRGCALIRLVLWTNSHPAAAFGGHGVLENKRMNERDGNWPSTGTLHPRVYLALIALAAWFVLSAWAFVENGHTAYLLVVVTGLVFFAVAIPSVLWWMAYRRAADSGDDDVNNRSFREWAAQDFATWQDHVRGSNAAIEILTPIAAVAFGMTAFAIVLHLSAQHPWG